MRNGVCERIAGLHENILGVFLIEEGMIIEWKVRPGIQAPRPAEMENVMIQRAMILMLAKMHQERLGDFHFNMIRYEGMDVLLFDVPSKKEASLLVVLMKRPYTLDGLAGKIETVAARL